MSGCWRACLPAGLILAASLCAAGAGAEPPVSAARADDTQLLPEWHGVWQGRLETLPAKADKAPSADVVLEVGPGPDPDDGCLTWRSTFTSVDYPPQVKDYRLCRTADGQFVMDEGGGLLLHTFVLGNVMYSAFEAQGTTLFSATRLKGNEMVFDIYFADKAEHPVPGITSFRGEAIQRTVFLRTARAMP